MRKSAAIFFLLLCSISTTGYTAQQDARSNSSDISGVSITPQQEVTPSWAIYAVGGIQAVGFAPVPANPMGAFGVNVALKEKGIYELRVGGELGFYSQTQLANAVTFDVPLINRFISKWGLYGDLELILGGELSWLNTPTYGADDNGVLKETSAPLLPHGRLGLGAAAGMKLNHITNLPVRFFIRYRQYGLLPYMQKNDVPVMGLASLSLGFALEMK